MGEGRKPDFIQALRYFQMAADNGHVSNGVTNRYVLGDIIASMVNRIMQRQLAIIQWLQNMHMPAQFNL